MMYGVPRGAVFVTGASSGIGEACALSLADRGFRVIAGVRKTADAERLTHSENGKLTAVLVDLTDQQSIVSAAREVERLSGDEGLGAVVHGAGIVVAGPLELLPIEQVRQQFEVNVIGLLALTQALLPQLRVTGGRIVNVGSVSGRVASPYIGPYAASKHALEAVTDALRLELRQWKISVSLIQAGSVRTPIWNKSLEQVAAIAERWSPESATLYQSDLDAMRRAVERIASRAMPVDRVVRAVVHAITASRPRTRYAVGIDARMGVLSSRFCPDRIRDWLVLRSLGMS